MKKDKAFLTVVISIFLIGISMTSCLSNDTDDYIQEATEMTEADLFIASEAYQNYKKEIRKDLRRRQNAISKFSKEEIEQYQRLREEVLNIETRAEKKTQLNKMLGYDYYANVDRIAKLAAKIYKGTNFTKLELMRARQIRRMNQKTRNEEEEAIQEAIQKCIDAYSEIADYRADDCYINHTFCISGIDSNLPFGGPREKEEEKCQQKLDQCQAEIDSYLSTGISACKNSNGKCPIFVYH